MEFDSFGFSNKEGWFFNYNSVEHHCKQLLQAFVSEFCYHQCRWNRIHKYRLLVKYGGNCDNRNKYVYHRRPFECS